jgi:sarcosine oxidase
MPDSRPHDVIVVGLGAMGSAAAYHLAARGLRVLGFDQYTPPHTLGSTHGRTRIIREAYFEHPAYVPLVRRAYELWGEWERAARRTLLRQTGGLMVGPPDGILVPGALASAREHAVVHELLSEADVRRRWPALQPGEGMVALFEERAGVLDPEACVVSAFTLARRSGAELRTGEPVTAWRSDNNVFTVTTSKGTYQAPHLIVTAGPWVGDLLPDLAECFTVERQVFHWFEPVANAAELRAGKCPLALWEYGPDRMVATMPDLGDGVKIGIHHDGEITTPQSVNRVPNAHDERAARVLLARFIPSANGALREAAVCLYTNTADQHFVIDVHPAHPRLLVASPCSGHGFKFTPAIGEMLADLVTTGASRFDLTPFRLDRLTPGRAAMLA